MTGLLELLHGILGEVGLLRETADQEREGRAGDKRGDQTSADQEAGRGGVDGGEGGQDLRGGIFNYSLQWQGFIPLVLPSTGPPVGAAGQL